MQPRAEAIVGVERREHRASCPAAHELGRQRLDVPRDPPRIGPRIRRDQGDPHRRVIVPAPGVAVYSRSADAPSASHAPSPAAGPAGPRGHDRRRRRAVRIAIIGSGPAGSYAAGHLLRHTDPELHVDLFERLPTPWGLVRAGVAPDHPKIKSVTKLYERTAEHPRLRLFANVEFGRHLTLDDLRRHYHAIIYAVGTPTDRPLGIPGEELAGSYAATEFVGWYNGHPDFCDHDFDLRGERAIVIGAGNVALDVARMLVLTHAELAVTDIADHALEVLDAQRRARGRSWSRAAGPSRPRSPTPSCSSSASSPTPT